MAPSAEASPREVLSRRVSELGLVRASELAGRTAPGRAGPGRAGPGRGVRAASHVEPVPREPEPEPELPEAEPDVVEPLPERPDRLPLPDAAEAA